MPHTAAMTAAIKQHTTMADAPSATDLQNSSMCVSRQCQSSSRGDEISCAANYKDTDPQRAHHIEIIQVQPRVCVLRADKMRAMRLATSIQAPLR